MKVAEITTYKEGGIYTHVTELAKRVRADTILITGNSKKNGYEDENGMRFFHVPCLFSFRELYFINPPGSYRKVRRALHDNDIQLVHMHGPLFTFGGALYRKSSIPVVVTTHYVLDFKGNRIASRLYAIVIRWVTKQMAHYAKRIICVNKEYPAIYASWGIDARKIVYIPNGIDTSKFSPGDSDIKQKLNSQYLVIYWGRLGYQKNVALLIQAFKQLKMPGAKLAIIGKGPDLPKLQTLASSDQRIIFPGYLPDDELVRYSIEDCPLFQNEKLLNKNLNEFANFIYEMRNKFVHNATLFHLSEEFLGSTSFMVDYIEYDFRYVKKPEFRGTIILKLSPNNLEKLLKRNFKKMLESYIASRVGNSGQGHGSDSLVNVSCPPSQ